MRRPAQPTPPSQHSRHLIGLLRNGLRFDTAPVLDEPHVLFTDVAGSRSMSPREVPELLGPYQSVFIDLFEEFFSAGQKCAYLVIECVVDVVEVLQCHLGLAACVDTVAVGVLELDGSDGDGGRLGGSGGALERTLCPLGTGCCRSAGCV